MIVRCKECKTKYRFDESLIDGEGAWVRCSRCKALFFLEKPAAEKMLSPSLETGTEDTRIRLWEKTQAPIENGLEPDFAQTSMPVTERKKEKHDPFEKEYPEQIRDEERDPGPQIEAAGKDLSEFDRDHLKVDKAEDMKIQHDEEDGPRIEEKPARSKGKQWLYLLVVLLVGGLYLWFFSEIGRQAADFTSSAATTLIEKIHGAPLKKGDVGPAQVDLTDIRQRLVANGSLGIIRVVEGTAVNQAVHPMTRIRVRGEIVGDGGVLLGERESFCGNLLTADELATMTEEQLQKELSNPQGSDVSNDRIAPKGQIPFMIVFVREPIGVVKTFVVPSGAERLLP